MQALSAALNLIFPTSVKQEALVSVAPTAAGLPTTYTIAIAPLEEPSVFCDGLRQISAVDYTRQNNVLTPVAANAANWASSAVSGLLVADYKHN